MFRQLLVKKKQKIFETTRMYSFEVKRIQKCQSCNIERSTTLLSRYIFLFWLQIRSFNFLKQMPIKIQTFDLIPNVAVKLQF